MKHIINILLVLLLSACAVPATPEPALAPTATPLPPTATPEPTPTLSPVEPLLESYLAGKSVDVSQLSPSEFKEFSTKLAEKKNAERGVNPVLYKDEAYINPENYMMMNYDGHPDQEETIEMYLAIAGKDSEGNLQIIDEKGKTVTIANSAEVDWNMVVTDVNDPRIDLAHTGPVDDNGFAAGQYGMLPGVSLSPMVLLDKNPGAIIFDLDKGGSMGLPTYHFLKVETDQNGNPILARKFLVFPAAAFGLLEEGSTNEALVFNLLLDELKTSTLHLNITPNSVYYLKIMADQEDIYKTNIFANTNGFTGLISGNEATLSLTGQAENQKDIILLGNGTFIKKAKN